MTNGPKRSAIMAQTEISAATTQADEKLPLFSLTAMVVGSMVGAGVFQLPARFATQTGVYGALIAWAIAGAGMLALALVFQTLAIRKPNLDKLPSRRPRNGSSTTRSLQTRSASGY
jgi:amino acid permease